MQHYIHYGLGFSASLLTEEQANHIYDNMSWPNTDEIAANIVSFTEGYEGKDWATLVLKDCGELGKVGKFATFQYLKKICSKEVIIDLPTKSLIEKELAKFNISDLYDYVEVIIFSENY